MAQVLLFLNFGFNIARLLTFPKWRRHDITTDQTARYAWVTGLLCAIGGIAAHGVSRSIQ